MLAACLAATGIAIILNPYGWRLYLMPLETARSMSMLRGLTEWTSVSGGEAVVWGCFVALVTCGLSLRRQPFPVILLVALAAFGAGMSNRNMPLFGVVAVFALGRTLLPVLLRKKVEVEVKVENGIVSSASASASAFLRKFDVKFEAAGGWFWVIAIPLVLAGAVRLRVPPMNLEFNFSRYPTAAVRYIENRNCPDNLFVRETWSSYLLWAMPDRKLFFDAKGGFSREAAEGHSELVKPKAGWRGVADRYGLSTCLLERGSPLAVVLSEAADWRLEYSDSLAEVFVHVPGNQERAIAPRSSAPHQSETPTAGNEEQDAE
jgi:hypothetical protein